MRGDEVVRSRRWAFKTPRAWGALRFAFRTLPAARLNLPCLASHAAALIHRQNPQCAAARVAVDLGRRYFRGRCEGLLACLRGAAARECLEGHEKGQEGTWLL